MNRLVSHTGAAAASHLAPWLLLPMLPTVTVLFPLFLTLLAGKADHGAFRALCIYIVISHNNTNNNIVIYIYIYDMNIHIYIYT